MQFSTILSLVGLCAVHALAATSTSTQSYSYSAPGPKDTGYVGIGLPSSTSADQYNTFTCASSLTFTASGSYFQCATGKNNPFPTSCGGGATPTMYYPSSVSITCSEAKATCNTQYLFADKSNNKATTGFFCGTETTRAAKITLYRSNPPELINGKAGASGIGGQYVMVGAIFSVFFTVGMAIML